MNSVPLDIDIVRQGGPWPAAQEFDALIAPPLNCAMEHVVLPPAPAYELAVVLTDDARIQALNARWRGKDAATDVLSFPSAHFGRDAGYVDTKRAFLGDIVLGHETIARQAQRRAIPFINHLRHLLVHGFLHLTGYHHDCDDSTQTMQDLEIAILQVLEIPDPYE